MPKCDLSGFADSSESHHSGGDKCSDVAAVVDVIPVFWMVIELVVKAVREYWFQFYT